jgi:catechol 2,3-dioxygenase-like lactoylglutathione lyase family enzyme
LAALTDSPRPEDRKRNLGEARAKHAAYPVGMITRMSHTSIFVLDQDSAKTFYTEKLGFEERFDIVMGEEFEGAGAGFRWLTVGPKEQPDLQIILSSCDMGRSPEAAAQLRDLVAGGSMVAGVMTTDNCRQTYEELLAKGVTFLSEPADRPYGIEATLRDDSGNMMSLVQPSAFG